MLKRLVLVIYTNRKFKGKDGREFTKKMYFMELENGTRVAVKPVFDEDYTYFNCICETEYNDTPSKPLEVK